jgi:hypothetical protein
MELLLKVEVDSRLKFDSPSSVNPESSVVVAIVDEN